MRIQLRTVLLLGAVALAMIPGLATANTDIGYSNIGGSSIGFDGSGNFTVGTFDITSGSAIGLLGNVSGSFSIGPITTMFGMSSASVSGSGILTITDGSHVLTGNLSWVDIVQIGTIGGLNMQGTVNLTGITYNGSNADLAALAAAGSATDVLSFQFTSGTTLSSLATSAQTSSFSGGISASSVPDGGATVALLGFGLVGIEGLRRRFTK
jgi:hypothetical protein